MFKTVSNAGHAVANPFREVRDKVKSFVVTIKKSAAAKRKSESFNFKSELKKSVYAGNVRRHDKKQERKARQSARAAVKDFMRGDRRSFMKHLSKLEKATLEIGAEANESPNNLKRDATEHFVQALVSSGLLKDIDLMRVDFESWARETEAEFENTDLADQINKSLNFEVLGSDDRPEKVSRSQAKKMAEMKAKVGPYVDLFKKAAWTGRPIAEVVIGALRFNRPETFVQSMKQIQKNAQEKIGTDAPDSAVQIRKHMRHVLKESLKKWKPDLEDFDYKATADAWYHEITKSGKPCDARLVDEFLTQFKKAYQSSEWYRDVAMPSQSSYSFARYAAKESRVCGNIECHASGAGSGLRTVPS